jgi:K+-sensing histidine kinase KdpD
VSDEATEPKLEHDRRPPRRAGFAAEGLKRTEVEGPPREVERLTELKRFTLSEADARDRIERLYQVASLLSRAVTVHEVATLVLSAVADTCHAEVASLSLVSDDEPEPFLITEQFVGVEPENIAPFARLPLTAKIPAADAVRSRTPVFIESQSEHEERYPALQAGARYHGGSRVSLPLVYRGEVLGAMNFGFAVWRSFEPQDRAFIGAVAEQCAQAIARSRIYDENDRARRRAEDAARVRDEMLAVVSHDLKNPLAVILSDVASLLREDLETGGTRPIRTRAERIQRSAKRMEGLIEDLVDFSSIQEGRLNIDARPHRAADILAAVTETFAPVAAEASVRLETVCPPEIPLVRCDRDRAVQALSNLVSNAVKVVAGGGVVELRIAAAHPEVVFSVPTTGPASIQRNGLTSSSATGVARRRFTRAPASASPSRKESSRCTEDESGSKARWGWEAPSRFRFPSLADSTNGWPHRGTTGG